MAIEAIAAVAMKEVAAKAAAEAAKEIAQKMATNFSSEATLENASQWIESLAENEKIAEMQLDAPFMDKYGGLKVEELESRYDLSEKMKEGKEDQGKDVEWNEVREGEMKQEQTECIDTEHLFPKLEGFEKEQVQRDTGWSDTVVDHIDTMEQYEDVLSKAGLEEKEVDGKTCLVKEIDPNYQDPKTGKTNLERMENGRAPIDSQTGEKIELHHLGQDKDGPLAELCENSEHGDGHHKILHPQIEGSWRNEPGAMEAYDRERSDHWRERAKDYMA